MLCVISNVITVPETMAVTLSLSPTGHLLTSTQTVLDLLSKCWSSVKCAVIGALVAHSVQSHGEAAAGGLLLRECLSARAVPASHR